ncbi:DUF742 domain-containing protein [Streptomyces sp. LaPpAH-108]|uniref:DUF742 domain-containing protein n=1 Tax=Streptomyces sp. LaPpAH-108 TaxID=1155714 RepID=UPI0003760FDB|nr:DUF742 domain-containing protein [Streptomyces sp. LaPpAH-108]
MNNGDRRDERWDGHGEGHLYDPYEGYGYRRYGHAEHVDDDHGPDEPVYDDRAHEEDGSDERWYEDETGAMVRPYTVTRGRTRPSGRHAVDLMSRVTALAPDTAPLPGVEHAGAALLELIRRGPRPLVELAVDADLPLTVVRVLLGDLAEAGLIRIDAPRRLPVTGPAADPELLREIVHRLRQI